MPTKVNFLAIAGAGLVGSAVQAANYPEALSPEAAAEALAGGGGTVIDKFAVDLSAAGYAKNGCAVLTLSASTPITLDLTALAAATGVTVAGDTAFATWNEIILNNMGANPVIVSVGASNPATLPLAGTTPTLTIPAGGKTRFHNPAGVTVDGTHKTIKFDPSAAAALIGVSVGGA